MAPFLHKMHTHPTILSAARFALVGILGTLVDFTLFFAAQMLLDLPILAANTVSYSAGILHNYYFHRRWTFAIRPHKAVSKQLPQFVLVSLAAWMINSLVVVTLMPILRMHLPDPALAAVLAKICATAAGLSWNFFANHLWTFRP